MRASQKKRHLDRGAALQPLYVRMRDGRVQTGVPFDLMVKSALDKSEDFVKVSAANCPPES